MAYFYGFYYLCENYLRGQKLLWRLTDELDGDKHFINMGKMRAGICLESHSQLILDKESEACWVSVLPWGKKGPRWSSGEPGPEDKEDVDYFLERSYSEMHRLYEFDFASPGVEVAGFRNHDEILELLKEDISLPGAVIHRNFWEGAGRPKHWKYHYENYMIYQEDI